METFITYATASTGRLALLIIAGILALLAWVKIAKSGMHIILKVLSAPIPLIPIFGPIIVFWIVHMPDRAPKDLRASMNHWGRGGRFIGGGSGRFTYSDSGDEAPDRPVKFKATFWKK